MFMLEGQLTPIYLHSTNVQMTISAVGWGQSKHTVRTVNTLESEPTQLATKFQMTVLSTIIYMVLAFFLYQEILDRMADH